MVLILWAAGSTFVAAADDATNYATGGTLVVVLGLVLTFAGRQLLDSRRDHEQEDDLRDAAQTTLVAPLTAENGRLREALAARDAEVTRLREDITQRYRVQGRLESLLRRNSIEIPREVYKRDDD